MKRHRCLALLYSGEYEVAFTPKGGCPLKLVGFFGFGGGFGSSVAFTPKGGCPLKRSG